MLSATPVNSSEELEQILQLQQLYLRGKTSRAEEADQGFLTVEHTLDTLTRMHRLEPSIIVKNDHELAGYALVMTRECRNFIPILAPMFENLDHLSYRNQLLSSYRFYVMGQVCVAKAYRGQGVFDLLYHKHKELLQSRYDFVITEIATRNTRSIRAHERVGFKPLHIYRDETDEWSVVIWDWQ